MAQRCAAKEGPKRLWLTNLQNKDAQMNIDTLSNVEQED